MTFREELDEKVRQFARESWGDVPDGYVVPVPDDLTFGNTGRRLNACILYADIRGSTQMVDALSDTLAAEYYKAFLHCAAKIVKRNGGDITAYDGDRVMAAFLETEKEDAAVGAALEINFAVNEIVNPQFASIYAIHHRALQHTVGVDSGSVLVSKTGVRIDSDLVWVGAAANYAAKLNSFDGLDSDYPLRVTHEVFTKLSRSSRFGSNGEPIWEGPYTNIGQRQHYRTRFQRQFA
jgi:class 3 adenylate cyclase